MDPIAISMRNVFKSYSSKHSVFEGINLTVSLGEIYGLLGPSGCGKTTLLNCIVGQTKVDSGSVTVFGFRAGTKGSGIPGSRVGYMPQDIALSQDLKVGETLNFYGVLLGMTSSKIKKKAKFLAQLLELPPNDRFIDTLREDSFPRLISFTLEKTESEYKNGFVLTSSMMHPLKVIKEVIYSGGQQRRVSLAVALINDPELIILDEPTVGVDPLLRKSIWNHLFDLASNNKQTILITTHYIEEARMAHSVGMMSDGVIICEGSPANIMQKHGCSSLESVFLKLCLALERDDKRSASNSRELDPNDKKTERENQGERENPDEVITVSILNGGVRSVNHSFSDAPSKRESLMENLKNIFELPNMTRIRAVAECNLRKSYRHIGHVLIQALIPCVLMGVFHLALGGLPKNVPIGVINEDEEDFGAVYLSYIDTNAVVLKEYATYEDGYRAVKNGETWGLLRLHSNFSTLLVNRFLHGHEMGHDVPFHGAINLAMDVTCQPVSLVVNDALIDAFIKFGQKLITSAGLEPKLISLPFEITYDIYDRDANGLMGFAVSGIILCGIYFLAVANCLISLFRDKSSGQLSRNIVSGITFFELLLANVATFSVAVLIQTVSYIVFTFFVLGYVCQGPIYVVATLTILHGICGVTYGLFISTLCSSEFTAIMLGFGTFLPSICLSGTVWPIESIPPILRDVCWLLPQSYVVDAMRSILNRSWDLAYVATFYGLVTNVVWIVAFLILSTTLLWLGLK